MSGKFISIPGALLVIVCFFLPWLTVSCNGQEVGQVSGQALALGSEIVELSDDLRLIDLDAVGGDIAWLVIPLSGFVGLLLGILAFLNKQNERGAGIGSLIFGILGFTVFILEYFLLQQSSGIPGITIETSYGLWGSILGLLLLVVGGLLMVILGGRTNTAVSQSAAYSTPPPVSTAPQQGFNQPNPQSFNQPNQSGGFDFNPPPTGPFGGYQSPPTVEGTPGFAQPPQGGGGETLLSTSPFVTQSDDNLNPDLPTAPFQNTPASPPAPPAPPTPPSALPRTILGIPDSNPDDMATAAVPPQNLPPSIDNIDSTIPEPPAAFNNPPPPPIPPTPRADSDTFTPPANLNPPPPPTIQAFPDSLPVEPRQPSPTPFDEPTSAFETIEDAPKEEQPQSFSHLFGDDEETFTPLPPTGAFNPEDLPDLSSFAPPQKAEPPAVPTVEEPEPPAPPIETAVPEEPAAPPAITPSFSEAAPPLPTFEEPEPPAPPLETAVPAQLATPPPLAPVEPEVSDAPPPVEEVAPLPEEFGEVPAPPMAPKEPFAQQPPVVDPPTAPPAIEQPLAANPPVPPPPPVAPEKAAPPPPAEVAPPPPPVQPVEPPPTVYVQRATPPAEAPTNQPPSSSAPKTEILQRFSETFATLVVAEGANKGRQYRLSNLTSIGRDGGNDVVINDTAMSGSHARIRQEDGIYYIYDLASTNGTYVYDKRTNKWERVYREPLEEGKQVKLGRTVLNFVMVTQ